MLRATSCEKARARSLGWRHWQNVENGHISEWDREWFHQIRNVGYKFIEWVEIGFVKTGEVVDYIGR